MPEAGAFYRLAAPRHAPGEPTTHDSWVLPVNRKPSARAANPSECSNHGHSMFRSIESLQRARALSFWARAKSIAKVALDGHHGLVLDSPSALGDSHCDWWPEPSHWVPDATIVEARSDR